MPRLHLIVEGKTELAFAARVLVAHLALTEVYLVPPQLAAHAKKKHSTHRGGLTSYLPFCNDVLRRLKGDRSGGVFLSTMVDLYGLPSDFPEVEASRSERDPYRRVARIEAALAEDIGDKRFLPHLQLFEFEALLLANPTVLLNYYAARKKEIDALIELSATVRSPELINDGENSAPSKRIVSLIPEYARAKSTIGPIVAAAIGLDTIRAKCPHFDQWLRKLEGLGTSTPSTNK